MGYRGRFVTAGGVFIPNWVGVIASSNIYGVANNSEITFTGGGVGHVPYVWRMHTPPPASLFTDGSGPPMVDQIAQKVRFWG